MKTMHVFYTNRKYVEGTEQDYIENAITGGYTFFQGYRKGDKRGSHSLKNVINKVKNSLYGDEKIKYDAIQLYKDVDGVYVIDKLIDLN